MYDLVYVLFFSGDKRKDRGGHETVPERGVWQRDTEAKGHRGDTEGAMRRYLRGAYGKGTDLVRLPAELSRTISLVGHRHYSATT